MKISLISLIFLAFLTGCGGGSDDTTTSTGGGTTGGNNGGSTTPVIRVGSNDGTRDVSAVPFSDVTISGNRNTIRITGESRVGILRISGNSDAVTVVLGATANSVIVSGDDCVVHLPAGWSAIVQVTGNRNQIVYDSTSG